jgi:Ala-tRNA(Pro) deacylase
MPVARLKKFLDERGVKYVTLSHSPAYTASEVAEATHVPGKDVAKTVMVELDGRLSMAVVPSSERVDLESLAAEAGCRDANLASEHDFARSFPGCELGAMPPFGNLWKIPVYVSRTLAEDQVISFSAGSHTEIMTLAFDDFRRLVEPRILGFSAPATF